MRAEKVTLIQGLTISLDETSEAQDFYGHAKRSKFVGRDADQVHIDFSPQHFRLLSKRYLSINGPREVLIESFEQLVSDLKAIGEGAGDE